tara:strand:- start:11922 stop:12179 length:258 start_codon:yes stop_codon:yes gene_type:complete
MDKIIVNSKEFFIKLVKKQIFNQFQVFTKNSFLSFNILNSIKRASLVLKNQFVLKSLSLKLFDFIVCGFIFDNAFLLNLKTIKYE